MKYLNRDVDSLKFGMDLYNIHMIIELYFYMYSMVGDTSRQPPYGGAMPHGRNRGNMNNFMPQQNNGMLPEPLIWTYVIQLTSALRAIHQVSLCDGYEIARTFFMG